MTNQRSVLVVEDDDNIRNGLVALLSANGYAVFEAGDGVAGLRVFDENRPSLVLLDVMMPGMNGYDVCRTLRQRGVRTPIIMLTAKDDEIDKVLGLELGADDYIVKPFGVHELLARVAAVLRRCGTGNPADAEPENAVFAFGPDSVDAGRYELVREDGSRVGLSARELALLKTFAAQPEKVLTRDYLLNTVWGVSYFGSTRTLDQHIAQLRKKFTDPRVVETLHGVGYRFLSRMAKRLAVVLVAVAALFAGAAVESGAPRATGEWLDAGWRFARFYATPEPKGAEASDFDASAWQNVRLPHDWGVSFPFSAKISGVLGRLPYFGTGWYKRDFMVTEAQRRGRVYLDFGGAMSCATVYVNGRKVGARPFGFISFRVDATDALVPGARQHLAVRLENRQGSGRWYHGGGLYRRVRLTFAPKVHVDTWGVTVRSDVRGADAEVAADVKVVGGAGTVACTVFDGERPVATLVDGRGVIRNVRRWDVDDPHLYVLEVRVTAADGETDVYRQSFGVRTVEFRPKEGLFLNGRYLKLRGVCQHSDTGALGTAAYARAFERQLELLKEMGANAVRTTHNPPSVEMLDACDRLGLMVLDEAFDMWTMPKGGPNSYARYFNDWWKTDLTDFIRRDRNHPSVILWSIGNEVGEQRNAALGLPIASNLVATCHAEDPMRPVTIGCDVRAAWTNGFVQVVDIFGVNYKADFYRDFYRLFPGRGLIGTETESLLSTRDAYYFPEDDDWGSLERPNRRGMYDFQVSSYEKYTIRPSNTAPEIEFKAQRAFPQCYGCFVWTGFDYLGEPSPYERAQPYHRASSPEKRAEMDAFRAQYGTNACPARSSYYGIFDLCGFPKDRYWSYRAEWRPGVPTAHILPHWTWPGREGRLTPVHVYANGDEATLYVNGKPQGRRLRDEALRFMWNNVRYEPGEVKVVVKKDGREWATAVRRTAGPAVRLEAVADRTTLRGLQDLAYVALALRDARGTVVPEADVELSFEAGGAVELIGVCNGDPTDWTGFQAGRQKTFHGLCQAVLRVREGQRGAGWLTARGGGLDARLAFEVRE